MQNCSQILPSTVENLNRDDLFLIWKNIPHALISTGHVAELHEELDHASRTGREDLNSSSRTVESCRNPALLSNPQTAASDTENGSSACYDNVQSIDGDMVMISPGDSEIDSEDLYSISLDFIAKAADWSHYHRPLPSFEDVLAQERVVTPYRRARRFDSFNKHEFNSSNILRSCVHASSIEFRVEPVVT